MIKVKVFTIVLLSFLFMGVCVSCDSDDVEKIPEGYGAVSFSLKADTAFVLTKADPENIEEYKIQILQGGKVLKNYSYSSLPDKVELEPGSYTAKAYWGRLSAAAFESLYMEGVTDFVIKENKTTQVSVACEPANAKVTVDYSSEVTSAYSNYYVSMSTAQMTSPLVFNKNETRAGYFKVNEGGEKLSLDMSFFVGSKEYEFAHTTTLKPKDFVRFHVKMDPNNIVPTMKVSPGYFYTGASGGSKDFIIYTNQEYWDVSYTADWIEVIEWDSYVTIKAYPNETNKIRQATILFKAIYEEKTATSSVVVVQEPSASGSNSDILVNPAYLLPNPEGETGLEVLVTCETEWTVGKTEPWIKAEKKGNKLIFDITANDTDALRSGSVEVKSEKDGVSSTATVFIFQEVKTQTPNGNSLTLDIYINDEFIKEEVIECELPSIDESKTPPALAPVGFSHGKVLTINKGQVPSDLRVNIRAMGVIEKCEWINTFTSYSVDLADNPESHPEIADLLWDIDMKGEVLSTIYLDTFVKQLDPGSYSYNIVVTDKAGKTGTVTLTLQIKN